MILDLHDEPSEEEFTLERILRIHKVYFKSPFHRNFLPRLPEDKVAILPNGVDTSLLSTKEQSDRKPFRLIYASSYDRGLVHMLEYGWPVIRKAIPEAGTSLEEK